VTSSWTFILQLLYVLCIRTSKPRDIFLSHILSTTHIVSKPLLLAILFCLSLCTHHKTFPCSTPTARFTTVKQRIVVKHLSTHLQLTFAVPQTPLIWISVRLFYYMTVLYLYNLPFKFLAKKSFLQLLPFFPCNSKQIIVRFDFPRTTRAVNFQ